MCLKSQLLAVHLRLILESFFEILYSFLLCFFSSFQKKISKEQHQNWEKLDTKNQCTLQKVSNTTSMGDHIASAKYSSVLMCKCAKQLRDFVMMQSSLETQQQLANSQMYSSNIFLQPSPILVTKEVHIKITSRGGPKFGRYGVEDLSF